MSEILSNDGADGERPLITFLLLAYKQEEYIRGAVEAAFAQTYSPLQIILSDDCSPDRTFAIMGEMAAAYRGPHEIRLNRTAANGQIGGNINSAMPSARGALTVLAAGDDLSLQHRVARNYEVWHAAGRPEYCSVLSGVEHFGEGREPHYSPAEVAQAGAYPPYLFEDTHVYNGSGQAFTTATFRLFGDFPAGLVNEDSALIVRNIIAGRLLTVDEPLVRHRLHGENSGATGWSARMNPAAVLPRLARCLRNREREAASFAADFQTAKDYQLPGLLRYGDRKFRHAMRTLAGERAFCLEAARRLGGGPADRILLLARCLPGSNAAARLLRKSWLQVLSPSLDARLRALVRRGKSGKFEKLKC